VGVKSLEITRQNKQKEMWAIYEKEPAHGSQRDGIIMGPFNTKEESEEVGEKYGYHGENYYVDIIYMYDYSDEVKCLQQAFLEYKKKGNNLTVAERIENTTILLAIATTAFLTPKTGMKEFEVDTQDDEFTCSNCFIVKHRSLVARKSKNGPICSECDA
jgi:hypothetical protein